VFLDLFSLTMDGAIWSRLDGRISNNPFSIS